MNKKQFLTELESQLYGLPAEDIRQSLDYYAEMIDDRIEDGISEEKAVSDIGTPQEIARNIFIDIPLPKLIKQKFKPKHRLKMWEIILLILGSPLWLPLIVAAIAVIFSIYVVLWSVIISLYAVDFSLAVSGAASIFAFCIFIFTGSLAQGVFILGGGFMCMGFAILLFFAFNQITKGLLWLSKKICICIKNCFIKRGDGNENC